MDRSLAFASQTDVDVNGINIMAGRKMLIALVGKKLIPLMYEQISRESKAHDEGLELLTGRI